MPLLSTEDELHLQANEDSGACGVCPHQGFCEGVCPDMPDDGTDVDFEDWEE